MAHEPLRRFQQPPEKTTAGQPKIWSEGGQRPPFRLGATARAALFLSREGVAPLLAWAARTTRRVAVNVRNGVGRIPEAKLGRAARFVPSHLRVAAWVKNSAAVLSHASATADPDIKRGNALVAEIEPHLWDLLTQPPPPPPLSPELDIPPTNDEVAPVVLPEPQPAPEPTPEPAPEPYDPLASIRDKLARQTADAPEMAEVPEGPAHPPAPPGPAAVTAIQMSGYALGWVTIVLGLPFGLARALWLYAKGIDLRGVGQDV